MSIERCGRRVLTGEKPLLHRLGDNTGLVTAALTFHVAAAEVINETHGREVLPAGSPLPAAPGRRRPA